MDDFVDATSNTVTPASEPADPVDGEGNTKESPSGGIRREKSPLRYQQTLSSDGNEPLTEISLDDIVYENGSRRSSDTATATDATPTIVAHNSLTPATIVPPELPPRKRGSISSASSGVSTPPIQAPSTAPTLPPRRGPFGWLRSGSTSSKSPPAPPLPPRSSVASVNFAPAALPNIELLIARLEEQSKVIKEGDEKVKEEFAMGNEELRKSFERIQKEHRPTEGEEDEIDWGTISLMCA